MSSAGMDNAGAETLRSLTAGIAGGRAIPDQFIARFASQLGVDPDTPLSAAQEAQARSMLGGNLRGGAQPTGSTSTGGVSAPNRGGIKPVVGTGYEQDEGSTGQGTPVGSTGGSPISPAPTAASGNIGGAPAQRPAPFDQRFNAAYGGGQGGTLSTPIGSLKEAERADAMAERYGTLSGAPGISAQQAAAAKTLAEQWSTKAKQIRETLGEYGTPSNNPFVQGQIKQYGGVGEAKAKRIGEVIESGGQPARRMLNDLDLIESALHSAGGNLTTGPSHEAMLKLKQVAANIFPGIEWKGLAEAETITKLNAQLASASVKQLTPRGTQYELKTYMANNPGLQTSTRGTLALINILRQATTQDIGLSRKAMNARNLENWSDVEDEHYRQNPIISPFTGKPLRGDESIPGMAGANGAAASGRLRPGNYIWTPQGLRPAQ